MKRPLGLAHLTVLDLPPPEMIRVAASIGYAHVGLRLIAVTNTSPGYPLMRDRALMMETRTALKDTGLVVSDIEFLKITDDLDIASVEPLLAAGAELGARHLITAPYHDDLTCLSDKLAQLAELAEPFAITPLLEFFPWTNVPDLAAAVEVVKAVHHGNAGILLDALHFDRSGERIETIRSTGGKLVQMFHICDAIVSPPYSTEMLLHTARAERLAPGTGNINLRAMLQQLPKDIPISAEVPMNSMGSAVGWPAVAEHVFNASQALFADSI